MSALNKNRFKVGDVITYKGIARKVIRVYPIDVDQTYHYRVEGLNEYIPEKNLIIEVVEVEETRFISSKPGLKN